MFYCDPCAKPRDWPLTGGMSYGPCEVCGTVAQCNDVPSGALPLPPGVEPIPPRDTTGDRYYLTENGVERQVDKAEYVKAERRAGFYNTLGRPLEPATSSWGNGRESGRIAYASRVEVTDASE
jgi:hypothetical protein